MEQICLCNSKTPAKGDTSAAAPVQLLASDEKRGRETGSKGAVAAPSAPALLEMLGACANVCAPGSIPAGGEGVSGRLVSLPSRGKR